MRCTALVPALAVLAVVGACAAEGHRDDEPSTPAPVAAQAATRPTRAASQPRQPAVFDVAVTRVDVPRAEDGAGHSIEATAPIAIDVRADQWPGRALDPVLHVDGMTFHDYAFVDKHTLRFIAADATRLDGAEVAVQYGDDVQSRVLVTTALAVTR